jgi:hypothetical protein
MLACPKKTTSFSRVIDPRANVLPAHRHGGTGGLGDRMGLHLHDGFGCGQGPCSFGLVAGLQDKDRLYRGMEKGVSTYSYVCAEGMRHHRGVARAGHDAALCFLTQLGGHMFVGWDAQAYCRIVGRDHPGRPNTCAPPQ